MFICMSPLYGFMLDKFAPSLCLCFLLSFAPGRTLSYSAGCCYVSYVNLLMNSVPDLLRPIPIYSDQTLLFCSRQSLLLCCSLAAKRERESIDLMDGQAAGEKTVVSTERYPLQRLFWVGPDSGPLARGGFCRFWVGSGWFRSGRCRVPERAPEPVPSNLVQYTHHSSSICFF